MATKIILKKGEEGRLLSGHLWVFSNEIKEIQGAPSSGDIVELFTDSGHFLGLGFFNSKSLISFRLLTTVKEEINFYFWKNRIASSYAYRKKFFPHAQSMRVVFGESDKLPGLVVDKYNQCLAVQFLSCGMEKNRDDIILALREVFEPAGIILRNDSSLRALEGLEEKIEVVWGEVPGKMEIEENKIKFAVHLHSGQKTGFFFDQKENRAALSRYCAGKKVLDCFSYTSGFSMYALNSGAISATAVDSSAPALEIAMENARINKVEGLFRTAKEDVLSYLLEQKKSSEKYDIIVLDPPALIKSRKHFQPGYKAYRKLNTAAMEILPQGGLLVTCSCSHNLSPYDFRMMLFEAAAKSGRQLRLIEQRLQSRDHPILLSMTETEYLKCAILEVV